MCPESLNEHSSHADALASGAAAARAGRLRTENPLPVGCEAWMAWMDGYDHQRIWLERGRGDFPSNEQNS